MKLAKAMVLTMVALVALAAAAAVGLRAQPTDNDFLEPFPAHHVMGNIYFVGSKGLGIYLITTPEGHILVNAGPR